MSRPLEQSLSTSEGDQWTNLGKSTCPQLPATIGTLTQSTRHWELARAMSKSNNSGPDGTATSKVLLLAIIPANPSLMEPLHMFAHWLRDRQFKTRFHTLWPKHTIHLFRRTGWHWADLPLIITSLSLMDTRRAMQHILGPDLKNFQWSGTFYEYDLPRKPYPPSFYSRNWHLTNISTGLSHSSP